MSGGETSSDPIKGLPHGPPFRFLNAVHVIDADRGEVTWVVDGEEDFLRGHFPGRPIVPGVLITESAAQLAGVVARARFSGADASGMLVFSEARFKQPVVPPAEIQLEVHGDRVMGTIHTFDFTARVNSEVCAEGSVGLKMDAVP